MSVTRTIPAAAVRDLNLHPGDSLHVLSVADTVVVELRRSADLPTPQPAKALEWLRTARGTGRLQPGETADDARMEYYAAKYGLPQ